MTPSYFTEYVYMDSDCMDAAALHSRYAIPAQLCVWAKVAPITWGQGKFSVFSIYPSFTTSIHNIARLLSIVHYTYNIYVYVCICVWGNGKYFMYIHEEE